MKMLQEKSQFGNVREITAVDYVKEVNQAGEGIWVVLHLYRTGIPLCTLINQHMQSLANKFPMVKFLKSISTTCIPNYPDKNLPTIFVYFENVLKHQIIGPLEFNGMNFKLEDFEWRLHRFGVIKSTLSRNENSDFEGDNRLKKCEDEMIKKIRQGVTNKPIDDDGDDSD